MSNSGGQKDFIFPFSEEIWYQTYKYHTDENLEDTQRRVAVDLASAEEDPERWGEEFYDALKGFKAVPGGRITSNAGTGLKGASYINCFVLQPFHEEKDSIDGIFDALKDAARTLKSEGGYGFCADFIRPRGSYISGVGVESPGAVEFLRLWDTMSSVITKGSGQKKKTKGGKNKIRKGAMMVTMSCWHPDIEEFVTIKQTGGKLEKFNMSVLAYDAFVDAVINGDPWELIYPDTTFENYSTEWDGNLEAWRKKGYPVIVHKRYEKAEELWDIIMTSTYERNEPGILFIDRANKLNNLWYLEHISATNPCGEQILPGDGGACLLGSLNLTQFINEEKTDWDYEKLDRYIPIFVRMLDNVNDKTIVPLPIQKWSLENKRRIGIGYVGYGSALYLLKKRYGSEEALKITDELVSFVTNKCYQASTLLAKEKGAFPLYNEEKYLESNFIKQALWPETIEMIKKYGIRNSHLASIQPTGNTSVYINNVSGGLEPVVSPEYYRTVVVPVPPDGLSVPVVDWSGHTFKSDSPWEWTKEGDEDILIIEFEGKVYKFDHNRGLVKEELIEDYAVHMLKESGEWDADADWAVDIFGLTIKEHIDTMKVFAKYICSAMSKTINVPNDYPYEDFKNIYMDMYKSGVIKGGTTYRIGTMTNVVSAESTADKKEKAVGIEKHAAPKRPGSLPCDVHQLTVGGEKWVVFVGLYDGQPYEIFAGLMNKVCLSKKISSGELVKHKKGKYGFVHEDLEIDDINDVFDNATQGAITRLASMSLRHGVDIKFVITQLLKTGNGLTTFAKCLARTLKKYVKEGEVLPDITCESCNSKNVAMIEGCHKCMSCGYSACS
jgi:ribonucleoside-diphosphate reductase alpha chain